LYESEEGIVYAKFEGTDDYVEVQLQFLELNISDASMQMCATDGGSAWFNLTALNDVVTNGENLDITWYEDEGLNNQIWTPTGYQSSGGTVYALIDDGDCYGVASISLTVGDILAYSSSMSLCADPNGGSTVFDLNSIDAEITGGASFDVEWYSDINGTNLITDATAYSISANETVYARVIASNLCSSDIVEVDLVIESTTAQEDTVLVCSAPFDVFDLTSVNDIVNNGTNNEVIWSTDANGSNIIANVDSFIPSGNAPYYVYASVCGDIVQIDLMGRNDEINLVLDYNEILLEGEDEIILGSNQAGLDHLWSPATGLDDAESEAPILEATTDLTYNLTVTDDIGCSDSKDFDVIVVNNKQDLVVTADIFSPNGDGKNDVIDLNLTGACTIDFRVFDRWGVEVYHSVSLDAYWDGRSLTGYNLSAGTYVIVVDVVYCGDDQSENYKKEIILMK
jgi:gliding motility-associated-like protein